MLFHHEYGLFGNLSYVYYLVYELLSPYIELLGIFATILAVYLGLINIPFMILFFVIYALYGVILTLTAFYSRAYVDSNKMSFVDHLRVIGISLLEIVALRFIQYYARITALTPHRGKRFEWGKIRREKLHNQ